MTSSADNTDPIDDPSQRYQSSSVVEGWRQGAASRAAEWGPASETMLDLAGLQPGSRVLDVVAGAGDQTLLAARRVGPAGYVLAIDISAGMLEVAAETAREAGLANVETRVMDARQLDLPSDSFDAAISRLLIMLVPEPHEVVAEIRRVLKPGGRLAAIVFSTPQRNPRLSIPLAIARRRRNLPDPAATEPGMYALGEPGLLERTLRLGGLQSVEVHVVPTVRRAASPAEIVVEQRSAFPRSAACGARVVHQLPQRHVQDHQLADDGLQVRERDREVRRKPHVNRDLLLADSLNRP